MYQQLILITYMVVITLVTFPGW